MKVVFMGTPDFALQALKALHTEKYDIVCVYTRAPKPSGRGHKETPSPVHQYALDNNMPVRCPTTLRTPEALAEFKALNADIAIVAAYGMILPQGFLDAFQYGCWNIHGSLLPRWRGAAPIQRAIMEGDNKTGVTLMQMDAGMDTGDMLLTKEFPLTRDMTAETVYEQLASLGAQALIEGLQHLQQGTLRPTKQPENGVTHAAKIQKEEGQINWSLPAGKIDCLLRGLTPYPGAWFAWKDDRVGVVKAEPVTLNHGVAPGTVLDDSLLVACGENALRLLVLKRSGKRAMDAKEFLNGCPVVKGSVL